VKLEFLAITNSQRNFDSAVKTSSATPSPKSPGPDHLLCW